MKRRFRFTGGYYTLDRSDLDGSCEVPGIREIWVRPALRGQAELTTLLHEAAHAEMPTASEETVERLGRNIGRFLWRIGYRSDDAGRQEV